MSDKEPRERMTPAQELIGRWVRLRRPRNTSQVFATLLKAEVPTTKATDHATDCETTMNRLPDEWLDEADATPPSLKRHTPS